MNNGFSSIRAKGRGDTYQASYHELHPSKELKHGITPHAEQIEYSDVERHPKFDRGTSNTPARCTFEASRTQHAVVPGTASSQQRDVPSHC